MVSALDSGLSALCSEHCVGSVSVQDTFLIVPLFTQFYKWLLVNLVLGANSAIE